MPTAGAAPHSAGLNAWASGPRAPPEPTVATQTMKHDQHLEGQQHAEDAGGEGDAEVGDARTSAPAPTMPHQYQATVEAEVLVEQGRAVEAEPAGDGGGDHAVGGEDREADAEPHRSSQALGAEGVERAGGGDSLGHLREADGEDQQDHRGRGVGQRGGQSRRRTTIEIGM